MTNLTIAEHPVFAQFPPISPAQDGGFGVNFVGQRFNPEFGMSPGDGGYPPPGEESFEWIAVLETVLDARGTLTLLELGAGFGRWMMTAASAARLKRPDLRFKFVGAEPEPTHYQWMRQHFIDNGVNPDEHELVEAAVNAKGGTVEFIVGHPKEWYGQAIVPKGWTLANYPTTMACYPQARKIAVRAMPLASLIAPLSRIDLVDMDVQGAELEIARTNIDAMTMKVKRAYVSTHSPEIHVGVAHTFRDAGWTLREMHGWTGGQEDTLFGTMSFVDGIQHWLNPHLDASLD